MKRVRILPVVALALAVGVASSAAARPTMQDAPAAIPPAAIPPAAIPAAVPTAARAAAPSDERARRQAIWSQALALDLAGRDAEAAALLRDLLAALLRDNPQSTGALSIQVRLMSVLIDLHDPEAALVEARSGYPRALAQLGPSNQVTQDFRVGLSTLLATTGRYDEAEPLMRQDFETELAAGGPAAARDTGYILARVYDGMGRPADARAIRVRVAEGAADDASTLESRIDLLLGADDKAGAEPLARRLVALRTDQTGGGDRDVRDLAQARLRLARTLFHSTDDVATDPRIIEAEALYRGLYAAGHAPGARPSAGVVGELGDLLILTADPDTPRQDEGLRLNEEALALMTGDLGPDHREVLARLSQVAVYQLGLLHLEDAGASVARFHQARDGGAIVPLTALVNVLIVDATLAGQKDDALAAWRVLDRDAERIHGDVALAGRRDGGHGLQGELSFVDRTRVTVAWRAAHAASPR